MKYIVTSDIHLGHVRTPTEHIIASFKRQILTDANTDIDALFIAGDMFDRLLDFNSKEVHLIISFFNYLLSYCAANNVLLRVLEGTPGHDWQQSQILIKLNDIRTNKCDVRYYKALDIEYIPSISKHVLYIPDEWANTHREIEDQIQAKLNEYNISHVDIALLHGQFGYQVAGKNYGGLYYNEDYFLKLVTGYIHIGHYHVASSFNRILANGSLDRLAHGEESDKGHMLVNGTAHLFIPNTKAFIYKTINVIATTTQDRLDKQIRKFPVGSHIRLLLSQDHPFSQIFSELKLKYLDYNLKRQVKESSSEPSSVAYILSDNEIEFNSLFSLSGDVHGTIVDLIHSKHILTDNEDKKLMKYLEIFKEPENARDTN